MTPSFVRIRSPIPLLPLVFATGCGALGELPDSLNIAVSADKSIAAPRDSGPRGLANSTWAIFRKIDPNNPDDASVNFPQANALGPYGPLLTGAALVRPPVNELIFLTEFDSAGRMRHISANKYFLSPFYGEDIEISDKWSPLTIPGGEFRSASYGLDSDGRFGLAVNVRVQFLKFYIGQATLYAWGTMTAPDRLDGAFGYLLDFRDGLLGAILSTGGDQYPIYALRQ